MTMLNSSLDRREFFKRTTLLAGVAFLPAKLIGCGTEEEGTEVNTLWESRATDLESMAGKQIRTEADPGPWEAKVGGHLPEMTVDNALNQVTVVTNHGMSEEHYITTIYVRDQKGFVVGLKEFSPTDAEAKVIFPLPKGTTSVTAYSNCNLHDHWMTEPVTI